MTQSRAFPRREVAWGDFDPPRVPTPTRSWPSMPWNSIDERLCPPGRTFCSIAGRSAPSVIFSTQLLVLVFFYLPILLLGNLLLKIMRKVSLKFEMLFIKAGKYLISRHFSCELVYFDISNTLTDSETSHSLSETISKIAMCLPVSRDIAMGKWFVLLMVTVKWADEVATFCVFFLP